MGGRQRHALAPNKIAIFLFSRELLCPGPSSSTQSRNSEANQARCCDDCARVYHLGCGGELPAPAQADWRWNCKSCRIRLPHEHVRVWCPVTQQRYTGRNAPVQSQLRSAFSPLYICHTVIPTMKIASVAELSNAAGRMHAYIFKYNLIRTLCSDLSTNDPFLIIFPPACRSKDLAFV